MEKRRRAGDFPTFARSLFAVDETARRLLAAFPRAKDFLSTKVLKQADASLPSGRPSAWALPPRAYDRLAPRTQDPR